MCCETLILVLKLDQASGNLLNATGREGAELTSHQAQVLERFERAVQQLDQVHECWAVGGRIDYFLKIAAPDVDAHQRFVDFLLGAEIGLKRYYA